MNNDQDIIISYQKIFLPYALQNIDIPIYSKNVTKNAQEVSLH